MNAQREAQRPSEGLSDALALRLLGPLEAELGGEPIALGPPKQRALLVQLAARPGEAVPVERIIDELWPEGPPGTARHAIHVYVSGLRKAFRDATRLSAHSRAYAIRLRPGELDLEQFRELVAEARALVADEPDMAARRLGEALALWRGRAVADLDGEPGVRDLVLELEEERLDGLELYIEAELASGRHAELAPRLERLIAEHPAREAFHAQLMLALYRAGRQAEALDAYRRARRMLLNELGLEPGQRLRDLQAAILRQDAALYVESRELRSRRHLPAPPDAFIGREPELAELTQLLSSGVARLVTLTGPGGVGKTRLAVAVAGRLTGKYPDGVWFVDLAPLRDQRLFEDAVARALGTKVELQKHLADKRLLLLLDNFEQLLGAALDVADLLKSCPGLDVLITSRERLRISGEHVNELQPLSESDAIALFTARGRALRRNLRPGDTEAAICRRLDGLPLAIELAAARLADFEANELLELLDRRLSALTEAPLDAPTRQQTLRATIEWSHQLLGDAESRLFACLGVFAGGCTADAATQVCGAASETLRALAEKSLVRPAGDRYSLLETVREYALERLEATPEGAAVRRRHADWCAGLLEQAWPELREGDQQLWLGRLESERDNIRAALDYAAGGGHHELELRLAARAGRFWFMQSDLTEGRRRLHHALEHANGDARLRAAALEYEAVLAVDQGDLAGAERLSAKLLANAEHLGPHERAGAFDVRGIALNAQGDLPGAAAAFERGLALSRELGAAWDIQVGLNNLAVCALELRDWEWARRLLEEAAAVEPAKDLHLTAAIATNLAFLEIEQGDFEGARSRLLDALRIFAELGLHHGGHVSETLLLSAKVAASDGDVDAALRLLTTTRHLLDDSGYNGRSTFGTVSERVGALTRELGPQSDDAVLGEPLSIEDAAAFALERLERRD